MILGGAGVTLWTKRGKTDLPGGLLWKRCHPTEMGVGTPQVGVGGIDWDALLHPGIPHWTALSAAGSRVSVVIGEGGRNAAANCVCRTQGAETRTHALRHARKRECLAR